LFFDAFYETSQKDNPNMLNSMEIDDLISENQYDKMGHYYLMNHFNSLRQDLFMPTSFRNFLLQKGRIKFGENMFNKKDYHPTEKAQHLWAKKLSLTIKRDING
jgi:hypothetical protein